ncbi:MAG: hypothetical protein KH048_04755 [Ruminococcus bicirculans]|nr:hypothetical protein [Ruminococcus bicirculans (ex Wegman et al. 2014)]RGG23886.1 hypothetical protein DWY44_03010 [Ruminococcus sp. AF25-19]
MIPALLVLILSTIPLFIFIGKDSAANRDAVRKVTSQETEVAAAAVFIVFLLCVVYISIAATKASAKHMRNFTCYAYYKGTLYSIGAAVPHSHSNTSNHGMRSIMKAQDDAMGFLSDHYTLKKLLDGEIENSRILVYEVKELTLLKENKNGMKVLLPNGRKQTIYKDMIDYDTLRDIIYIMQK